MTEFTHCTLSKWYVSSSMQFLRQVSIRLFDFQISDGFVQDTFFAPFQLYQASLFFALFKHSNSEKSSRSYDLFRVKQFSVNVLK